MKEVIGSSVILQYHHYHVFEIQKQHKWLHDEAGVRIGIGCIGGKIEDSETPREALHREAEEEISSDIDILPSKKSFIITPDFKIAPLNNPAEKDILFYWHGYNNQLISTYYGITNVKPKPNDLPAILLVKLETLCTALQREVTIAELLKMGGVLLENQPIPLDARIFPKGTVEILAHIYQKPDAREIFEIITIPTTES